MVNSINPLVSIIIPSYNHSKYVEDAILSVLVQTYENIQLIVIDDASIDDSVNKITSLREKRSDKFVFLKNDQNIGLQRSLIKALQEVKGEYIGIIASDDMLISTKVELLMSFIQRNNLDGAYASGFVLGEDGKKTLMDMTKVEKMFKDKTYLDQIYTSDCIGALFQSGLFKTGMMRNIDYIREKFWSDDWAIAIKLMESYHIGFLNEPTVIYRIHEGNTYKNYWNTFPGRVQVVSCLTPKALRPKALANLFISQADYLIHDGEKKFAYRFYLAALVMNFSWNQILKYLLVLVFNVRICLSKFKRKINYLLN